MQVAQQCKENIFAIQTLKDFQYLDDNKDQGINVREKAKSLVALLKDDERLRNERVRALKAKERFAHSAAGIGSDTVVSCNDCHRQNTCQMPMFPPAAVSHPRAALRDHRRCCGRRRRPSTALPVRLRGVQQSRDRGCSSSDHRRGGAPTAAGIGHVQGRSGTGRDQGEVRRHATAACTTKVQGIRVSVLG